jgi:translation initiation factor 4A
MENTIERSIHRKEESSTNYKVEHITEFDDFNLKDTLLRGIYAYGFEKPSVIQQKAIKPIIDRKDVIGQAQSGTGKTATFSIGLLEIIDEGLDAIQGIVLAPTRELAGQIYRVQSNLAQFMDVTLMTAIGGTNLGENIEELKKNPHIIIATPGRLIDLFNRVSRLDLSKIKQIVIDESDEMLSRGFKDQLSQIFRKVNNDAHVAIFSATLPTEVLDLTQFFMNNPVQILVKNDELTLEGIKQFYIGVDKEEWKFDTLCDLYEAISVAQSIIYCNSRKKVEWLTTNLIKKNFTATCIHGDMEQDERSKIMSEFISGSVRILITTNLLARGIDVQQVSVVINYDLPHATENYIHRIGRSGRFGRKGLAINFATSRDIRTIRDIESFYSTSIDELPANLTDLI